jgi:hypothetical protein
MKQRRASAKGRWRDRNGCPHSRSENAHVTRENHQAGVCRDFGTNQVFDSVQLAGDQFLLASAREASRLDRSLGDILETGRQTEAPRNAARNAIRGKA